MGAKNIFCKIDLCRSCKSCEIGCAVMHTNSRDIYRLMEENGKARIKVEYSRKPENGFIIKPLPVQCRHCKEPLCVRACMTASLKKEKSTGDVKYEPDTCVGCYMCVMVCPYGAITPQRGKKLVLKCDHCEEIIAKGHITQPACVTYCPTGALVFCEETEFKES